MSHRKLGTCLAILVVLGFVARAHAVWNVAGGVAYTTGSPGSGNVNYSTDPNNTGLDGQFQNGTDGQGNGTVTLVVSGCCLAPNCAPGENFGVKIKAQVQIVSASGSWTKTHWTQKCPISGQCIFMTITRNEFGEWWSAPATSVNVQVTVSCICCNGGAIIEDPDEYPDFDFPVVTLTPVS